MPRWRRKLFFYFPEQLLWWALACSFVILRFLKWFSTSFVSLKKNNNFNYTLVFKKDRYNNYLLLQKDGLNVGASALVVISIHGWNLDQSILNPQWSLSRDHFSRVKRIFLVSINVCAWWLWQFIQILLCPSFSHNLLRSFLYGLFVLFLNLSKQEQYLSFNSLQLDLSHLSLFSCHVTLSKHVVSLALTVDLRSTARHIGTNLGKLFHLAIDACFLSPRVILGFVPLMAQTALRVVDNGGLQSARKFADHIIRLRVLLLF